MSRERGGSGPALPFGWRGVQALAATPGGEPLKVAEVASGGGGGVLVKPGLHQLAEPSLDRHDRSHDGGTSRDPSGVPDLKERKKTGLFHARGRPGAHRALARRGSRPRPIPPLGRGPSEPTGGSGPGIRVMGQGATHLGVRSRCGPPRLEARRRSDPSTPEAARIRKRRRRHRPGRRPSARRRRPLWRIRASPLAPRSRPATSSRPEASWRALCAP
jgi:hypothetical protein